MRLFIDSSALTKKYVREKGTDAALEILAKADHIYVSQICLPEIFSALNRNKRDLLINQAQYIELKENVLQDFAQFTVCQLTPHVLSKTVLLLEQHSLRTMDAIHLASALAIQIDLFVSADIRQITAAKASKIKTLRI